MEEGTTKTKLDAALGKFLTLGSGMRQIPGLSVALSPRAAIGMLIVLICALAWSFYMGFKVGRGEHPAEGIPAVENLLEKQAQEQGQTVAEIPPAVNPEPAPAPDAGETPASAPAPAASSAPFTRPDEAGMAAWSSEKKAPDKKPAAKAEKKDAKKTPAEAGNKSARYVYTYQVAAVKGDREAANLQKKIKGAGLSCSLRKSGKVTLAIVTFRGTEADARAFPQKLRAIKLGKPLLLSRKEAGTPGKGVRKKK